MAFQQQDTAHSQNTKIDDDAPYEVKPNPNVGYVYDDYKPSTGYEYNNYNASQSSGSYSADPAGFQPSHDSHLPQQQHQQTHYNDNDIHYNNNNNLHYSGNTYEGHAPATMHAEERPSKVHGVKDTIVGGLKLVAGHVAHKEALEQRGRAQKDHGETELHAPHQSYGHPTALGPYSEQKPTAIH